MRLKKLELNGFKSFALRTEILFNEGITAIVGPNGSGKSNISDAVRWVLGEQSAKTLRGSNMADVIFGGTLKRKPMGYAEVSLYFDNEDRSLPMDFAEIVVTRRVYRNGDSEYYLNRSSCRLKDVVDLFRDTGIGKEGYSIIGQGRIDDILSRRSEDRRVIFEEAAGITKSKTRKEEADRKLERTLENADRLQDILDELNRQLIPLEEQSRKARAYIAYSDELKGLELNLFLIQSDRASARLKELAQETEALQEVLENTARAIEQKALERDRQNESLQALEQQAEDLRLRLNEELNAIHEADSRLSALTSARLARQGERERMLEEQQASDTRMAELTQLTQSSEAAAEEGDRLTRAAEAELDRLNAAADQAEQAADQAENTLESHKAAVLQAMNRISASQNDQTRLKTMQAQMTARLLEIQSSEQLLDAETQRLDADVHAAEDRLAQERALQAEKQAALDARLQAAAKEEQALSGLRLSLEQQTGSLQAAQSRFKLLNEMTREMEGYNQSVKRAMQFGRRLQGVHGVLAELLEVPRDYETAMDMALGAAQQNIVTENEQVAKQLIDHLRMNKLGRATFLPCSAIRPKLLNDRERQVLTMPGCIGVASELVRFPEKFRNIIENLLGRTVIADNLEHGIAIQRAGGHSFRLVTLNGDVMHSGGSMTGGSVQSKMVNLLSRGRELKELEASIARGQEAVANLRQQMADKTEALRSLREQQETVRQALHEQEIAVARAQEQLRHAQEEQSIQQDRAGQTAQAGLQLREALNEIAAQLHDITEQTEHVTLDHAAMEQQTEQLQQARVEARTLATAAREEAVAAALRLNDLRHELDSHRRDSSRLTHEKEQAEQDRLRRRERLDALDALDQAAQADESRLGELMAERRQAVEAMENRRRDQDSRRQQLQTRQMQLQQDTDGLYQSRDRDSEALHKLELASTRVDGDLKQLQNRIWDTYELTYGGAEAFRQTEGFDAPAADRRAKELNRMIRELGPVNVGAVEEYAETKLRHEELSRQMADLRQAETDLRELIQRLLEQMRTTFVENFSLMQGYFSETFTRLFGGGQAELVLTDPSDPLNCGIEVNAQPPGKKLQLLSLLSGGERTLTAIAILFAMLKLKPTPFCILDEIEAALDDANIAYYADYLKEYSQSTQFIVITHRKGTMERANSLFGVAMEEQGVSKMVSVSLQDYQE